MAQPAQIERYNKRMADSLSYGHTSPRRWWSAGCSSYCSLGTRWKESRTGGPASLSNFIVIDGGERKSLIEPAGGGRPTLWLAASAVSLRASTRHRRNETFCKPASPQVRPLMPMRWQRSACCRPRLVCASPRVAEVGRPTVLGLDCVGGWTDSGGCSESAGLSVFRRRAHTGIRGWGAVSGFLVRIFHLIQRPAEPDATFPSRGRLWLAAGSGGGWD